MQNRVNIGSKGTCRYCDRELRFSIVQMERGRYRSWLHTRNDERACNSGINKYATPKEFCTEHTEHGGPCHRPVKEDGMCGIHVAAERKRSKNDQAWRDRMSLNEYTRSEVLKLQMDLKERYGIDSQPDYAFQAGSYTGLIKTNPRELLSFLDAIFGDE